MANRRKTISELAPADSLTGLYTIGYKVVNGVRTSVKAGLGMIQTAYENMLAATTKANTAATNADTSRTKLEANEKTRQDNESARKTAEASRVTAETARANAEASRVTGFEAIKANALSATDNANAAAADTRLAISNANDATARANEAAANAKSETEGLGDIARRLEELEGTIVAKDRRQPTGMTLDYPRMVTMGNRSELRIRATLTPAGTGNNVLFLGDDKAVTVTPDGYIILNGTGVSRVHVIPTENTAIYRTIGIRVAEAGVRLTARKALRLMGNGGIRLR